VIARHRRHRECARPDRDVARERQEKAPRRPKLLDHAWFQGLRQFQDFDVGRAFRPVVAPADDHVAAVFSVAMPQEVAALKFKLNADVLPHAAVAMDLIVLIQKPRVEAWFGRTDWPKKGNSPSTY